MEDEPLPPSVEAAYVEPSVCVAGRWISREMDWYG